jgi:uncharacterized protein (DUF2062 family)
MSQLKKLAQTLLHIEDTPERTAMAYSLGVFLGFSPFLGFHTLLGVALAFVFRLNRVAVLLGVWSNTPWFVIPFYSFATWIGMGLTGFGIDHGVFRELFRSGVNGGFLGSHFWGQLISQWGLLFSFGVGSLLLSAFLSLTAYPLSLRGIRYFRLRGKAKSNGEMGY